MSEEINSLTLESSISESCDTCKRLRLLSTTSSVKLSLRCVDVHLSLCGLPIQQAFDLD